MTRDDYEKTKRIRDLVEAGSLGPGNLVARRLADALLQIAAEDERSAAQPTPTHVKWRAGRHIHRTVYAMLGPEPSDEDPLIGVMDSRELAAEAVEAHNERLTR